MSLVGEPMIQSRGMGGRGRRIGEMQKHANISDTLQKAPSTQSQYSQVSSKQQSTQTLVISYVPLRFHSRLRPMSTPFVHLRVS